MAFNFMNILGSAAPTGVNHIPVIASIDPALHAEIPWTIALSCGESGLNEIVTVPPEQDAINLADYDRNITSDYLVVFSRERGGTISLALPPVTSPAVRHYTLMTLDGPRRLLTESDTPTYYGIPPEALNQGRIEPTNLFYTTTAQTISPTFTGTTTTPFTLVPPGQQTFGTIGAFEAEADLQAVEGRYEDAEDEAEDAGAYNDRHQDSYDREEGNNSGNRSLKRLLRQHLSVETKMEIVDGQLCLNTKLVFDNDIISETEDYVNLDEILDALEQ